MRLLCELIEGCCIFNAHFLLGWSNETSWSWGTWRIIDLAIFSGVAGCGNRKTALFASADVLLASWSARRSATSLRAAFHYSHVDESLLKQRYFGSGTTSFSSLSAFWTASERMIRWRSLFIMIDLGSVEIMGNAFFEKCVCSWCNGKKTKCSMWPRMASPQNTRSIWF